MEQTFITWLEENFADVAAAFRAPHVVLGIGDDGAVLDAADGKQVLVADAIVDQVHFDLAQHELDRVGHKSLAVNLSDIAAMGAIAESALVSFVLPKTFDFETAAKLFSGVAETARKYNVPIIGGDTCVHDGAMMISIVVTGRIPADAKVPDGWRMDAAKVGDLILVTGALGGSIHGKHLDFEPRLEVARDLQRRIFVHAATDISDSLSLDLSHVIRKSNVGARLHLDQLPVSDDALKQSGGDKKRAIELALNDGEDFELLLFMSPRSYAELESDPSFEHSLHVIGEVTGENVGVIHCAETGEIIEAIGYEHD